MTTVSNVDELPTSLRRATYKADVHSNTYTSLQRSSNVVAIPCHTLRDIGVDSRGNHEASNVLGREVSRASQDGKPSHAKGMNRSADRTKQTRCVTETAVNLRNQAKSNHENTTLTTPISNPSTTDGKQASHNIGRDSHKLSYLSRVSQIPNNGGEEDGDRVQRRVDTDGDEHVDVDLPILEGVPHELRVELVGEHRSILFEAADNLLLFVTVEESSRVRVVVHSPERSNG
jgi:hypothetical protein